MKSFLFCKKAMLKSQFNTLLTNKFISNTRQTDHFINKTIRFLKEIKSSINYLSILF